MKIDLHVHTKERSSCSIASAEEHINQAIKMGLDAIVITDHDCMVEKDILDELNDRYSPFKIFGGIELRINESGHDEDILVIGVHETELSEQKWTYRKLHEFVISKNGFIALAHPYRYRDFVALDMKECSPHAIEIYSSNIGEDKKDMRLKLANELDCQLITNSDGHNVDSIGKYYNHLNRTPNDEKELVELLINGEYTTVINV